MLEDINGVLISRG